MRISRPRSSIRTYPIAAVGSCTSRRTLTGAENRPDRDMNVHPNITILAILTMSVGYLMVVAGLHKSLLELRRHGRQCPSCGRAITERVCAHCAR